MNKDEETLLRLRAGAVYLENRDDQFRVPGDLRKDPRFMGLSSDTLERWATRDGWEQARARMEQTVTRKLHARVGERMLRNRLAEYKHLEDITVEADRMLVNRAVAPKSWEGLARARVELGKRMEEIVDATIEQLGLGKEDPLASLDIAPEEREAIVEMLLRMRQQKMLHAGQRSIAPVEDEG